MDKREKTERARQEDAILNKVLFWIVGAVVLEALLLLLNKYYVQYIVADIEIAAALHEILPILAYAFGGVFVACGIWTIAWARQKKSLAVPAAMTIIFGALALCSAVARWVPNGTGVRFLYVAVPVVAVLAMIYYLYQREFFLVAGLSTVGLMGLWLLSRRLGHEAFVYGCLIVLAVALVGCVVVTWVIQSAKGMLTIKGRQVRVFPKNANYVMIYVTCGLVALVLAAGIVLGTQMLLYAVLVAWLLIMAVYYTVKLM